MYLPVLFFEQLSVVTVVTMVARVLVNLTVMMILAYPSVCFAETQSASPELMPFTPLKQSSPAPQSNQSKQGFVLHGSVFSIQDAMAEESHINWYQWYLSARNYLAQTGGLNCPLGTPIVFYKSGQIGAKTTSARCLQSISGRFYPLPKQTRLQALFLPVRSGKAPPASVEEIQWRVNNLSTP